MPTQEAIKAGIMSKVEKLVDEALGSGKKRLTITEIEELALEAGGKIEEEITKGLLERETAQSSVQIPECGVCGERMHGKGTKKRYLQTRSGDIEMKRPYFYCKTCQKGLFPPR